MDLETQRKTLEYRLAFTATVYFLWLIAALELSKAFSVHCSIQVATPSGQLACRHFFGEYVAHPYFPAFVLDDLQGLQHIWWLPALVLATVLLPPYRRLTLMVLGPIVYIGAVAQTAPFVLLSLVAAPGHNPGEWQYYVGLVSFLVCDLAVVLFLVRNARLLWLLLYAYRAEATTDGSTELTGWRSHVRRLLDYRLGGVLAVRDASVIVWWHQIGPFALGALILTAPRLFERGRLHDTSTLLTLQSASGIGVLVFEVLPFSLMVWPMLIVVLGPALTFAGSLVIGTVQSILGNRTPKWVEQPTRSVVQTASKWMFGEDSPWVRYPGRTFIVAMAIVAGVAWLSGVMWAYWLREVSLVEVSWALAVNVLIVPMVLVLLQAIRWMLSAGRQAIAQTHSRDDHSLQNSRNGALYGQHKGGGAETGSEADLWEAQMMSWASKERVKTKQ